MSKLTIPDRVRRATSPLMRSLFRLQGRLGASTAILTPSSVPLPTDGRPIIFAANHTNSEDIPRIATALNQHFYVVAATDGMFGLVNKMVCNAYGTIWLDRHDTEEAKATRTAAQDLAITKLKAHINVVIFPEAVWMARKTWIDGKPMLPFFKGVVTIARSADAHIVPIVLEYTSDKICHVHVGESFDYGLYGEDSIAATHGLRDTMAQMKEGLRMELGPLSEEEFLTMRTAWRKAYPHWDPVREVKFIQGHKKDPATIEDWFLV